MGMDWHSSGITTSVMGALKKGLNPKARTSSASTSAAAAAGSRAARRRNCATSRIASASTATRWCAPAGSRHASTTTPIADGFQIYLHSFIVTSDGDWAIVQQGMNEATRLARRYHWHSATVRDFTADPHTAIVGEHAGTIQNLVDARARPGAGRAADHRPRRPGHDARRRAAAGDAGASRRAGRRRATRSGWARCWRWRTSATCATSRRCSCSSSSGRARCSRWRSIAEVVHGTPTRFDDPARFSFAHGGKDGHPFPVPLKVYDESIAVLQPRARRRQAGALREAGWLRASRRVHARDRAQRARLMPTSPPPSRTSARSRRRLAAARCSTMARLAAARPRRAWAAVAVRSLSPPRRGRSEERRGRHFRIPADQELSGCGPVDENARPGAAAQSAWLEDLR